MASIAPTTQFGNPGTFTAAANTQASDYDTIMQQYKDFIASSAANPLTSGSANFTPTNFQQTKFNEFGPQLAQYNQSSDVTNSLAGLSDLATTGGYSEADKQNIRERDISPIRSIYANAQQNAERAKALGGGYSPNFNASQLAASRDEANKVGDVTTAANAGIAQNVAANRLSAAPAYASASSTANAAKTAADKNNADIINANSLANSTGNAQTAQFNAAGVADMNKFNATGRAQTDQFNIQAALDAAKARQGNTLGAIQGQANLYGTTPALTSTFGSQVATAAQLGQNQQQLNQNQQKNILQAGMGG